MAFFLEFDESKLRARRPVKLSLRNNAPHPAFAKFIGQFESIDVSTHSHPHSGR